MALLRVVVAFKLLLDVVEDFQHKLAFVKIESFEQHDHKLDKTVNKSVVQSIVVGSSPALSGIERKVNAMLYHLMRKGIQHFLILINAKCAEVTEIVVHFLFLCSRVVDVRKLYPFLI